MKHALLMHYTTPNVLNEVMVHGHRLHRVLYVHLFVGLGQIWRTKPWTHKVGRLTALLGGFIPVRFSGENNHGDCFPPLRVGSWDPFLMAYKWGTN